jgi:hypothetical protein
MKELAMTTTTGTSRQSRQAHLAPTPHDGRRPRVVVGVVLAGVAAVAVIGVGAVTHRSGQVTVQNPASTPTVPAAQSRTLDAVEVPDAAQRLQARYGADGTG